MHDDEKKTGREADRVEEASGESFPASDPPAWTAARAGKPEHPDARDQRRDADALPPVFCEAVGLFRTEAEAQAAADALLASGFNLVDTGPPRRHGNLAAGIGARAAADRARSMGVYAALGALAAGTVAALFAPRGARYVAAAAAGGAIGAASAHAAAAFAQRNASESDWPPGGVLLRVKLKTPDDQRRAFAILEGQRACKLHVSWQHAG
jgi:hypothetical protein